MAGHNVRFVVRGYGYDDDGHRTILFINGFYYCRGTPVVVYFRIYTAVNGSRRRPYCVFRHVSSYYSVRVSCNAGIYRTRSAGTDGRTDKEKGE